MPELVDVLVVHPLIFAVFARRDNRPYTRILRLFDNGIAVIPSIRQKIVGINPFDQLASLSAICCGTVCNKDSDRHTMRIHGQMYFAVEPPFVSPMLWLPPLAPAACG